MAGFEARRDNLTSRSVKIHRDQSLDDGSFRNVCMGTYQGGNRNQQDCVCKKFKWQFRHMEREFYKYDSDITEKAIQYANQWNEFCAHKREIMINCGDKTVDIDGQQWLYEPFINNFQKFTSNGGYISSSAETKALEAFVHYTYHKSGGSLIVCDLQGRYRADHPRNRGKSKARYELTDLAICSRTRKYGPTDLSEKGIDSFFSKHRCNDYCHSNGKRWARPRNPQAWFPNTEGTSMMSTSFEDTYHLKLQSTAKMYPGREGLLEPILDDSDGDY